VVPIARYPAMFHIIRFTFTQTRAWATLWSSHTTQNAARGSVIAQLPVMQKWQDPSPIGLLERFQPPLSVPRRFARTAIRFPGWEPLSVRWKLTLQSSLAPATTTS
jgi:hypothetical protein